MEYQVIGDDEVLIKDGERNVGVIRIQGINWVPEPTTAQSTPNIGFSSCLLSRWGQGIGSG